MKFTYGIRLAILFFFINTAAFAQVGMISNTPDRSAALDLKATNKQGVLIPQVNLNSTTHKSVIAGGAPVKSLLVYNTNSGITGKGAAGEGFYYWDATMWQKLVTPADTTVWSLYGNSNTDPSVNFIGTTNSNDWIVKTNNIERMRVNANGNIGMGDSDNDITNTLDVKAPALPVRFETLSITNASNAIPLVVNASGVVKKAAVGLPHVAYLQSSTIQNLSFDAFSMYSGWYSPAVLSFVTGDILLNNIGTWNVADNSLTVTNAGEYDVTGAFNFYTGSTGGPMAINVVIQAYNTSTSTWDDVVGSRAMYNTNGHTQTCSVSGVGVLLNGNTKIRFVAYRGAKFYAVNNDVKANVDPANGITYSKYLKVARIR
ncbi:hypothetical protein [Solitalea canadensis]|nr:hypothetical protein [Solitalea canadensis]